MSGDAATRRSFVRRSFDMAILMVEYLWGSVSGIDLSVTSTICSSELPTDPVVKGFPQGSEG
jgi:hypothetical protein